MRFQRISPRQSVNAIGIPISQTSTDTDTSVSTNSMTNGTSSLALSSSLLFSLPTNSTQSTTSSFGSPFNHTSVPADLVVSSAIRTTGAYLTYANQTGYWNSTSTLTNNSAPSTTSYVSGSAAIWSCGVACNDYLSAVEYAFGLEAGLSPVLETSSWTTNVTVYDTYTLCDGIPRVILSGPTITTTYLTTAVVLENFTRVTLCPGTFAAIFGGFCRRFLRHLHPGVPEPYQDIVGQTKHLAYSSNLCTLLVIILLVDAYCNEPMSELTRSTLCHILALLVVLLQRRGGSAGLASGESPSSSLTRYSIAADLP